MMQQFGSFDIEIFDDFPEGESNPDLRTIIPSIAAYTTDYENVEFFYDEPYMTKETGKKLVNRMMDSYREGYTPFTWNGLSFDFQLLAHWTGMYEECGKLALNGIDGMFIVFSKKGYFLGLDKVLFGAGIETKVHEVTLNDKTVFAEMNGSKAPLLWRNGEYDAVKEYLWGDVVQPLKWINSLQSEVLSSTDGRGGIRWKAGSGRNMTIKTELLTVKQCLQLEEPDTSWMAEDKPKKMRWEFYHWIPMEVQRAEGIIKNTEEDQLPF